MRHLVSILEELGVTWTLAERERRLFPLCVHVQATLRARYGDAYRTPDVSQVPAAYVDDAKEIIRAEFPPSGE